MVIYLFFHVNRVITQQMLYCNTGFVKYDGGDTSDNLQLFITLNFQTCLLEILFTASNIYY